MYSFYVGAVLEPSSYAEAHCVCQALHNALWTCDWCSRIFDGRMAVDDVVGSGIERVLAVCKDGITDTHVHLWDPAGEGPSLAWLREVSQAADTAFQFSFVLIVLSLA